jgi:ABC-type lipoprotein export system ATPase subunit
MRLIAVTVSNIGGLPDGRVVLPENSIVALAGANGTGKSKLLACLLSPWSNQLPTPREGTTAEVVVELALEDDERRSLQRLSELVGWGTFVIPKVVHLGLRRGPIVGLSRFSVPAAPVLDNFSQYPEFVAQNPSLNVIYLPAERRLLEPRQQGIDLNQLTEAIALQKNAESRNAVGNYGRLDDQEFEDFAKALCVASTLPIDDDDDDDDEDDNDDDDDSAPSTRTVSGINWSTFRETVNSLIAPKELLSLTRAHPDQLRIRTATGDVHSVRDLSSGERQALIIISRVLRVGSLTPLVIIDEPDAYLHPHLSKRLILALEDGVGRDGQLVVATHSPAILDGVPPASILRLEHATSPRIIADESERLELYRAAGFRSSALTQSNLLLITEGTSDIALLSLALPQLSSAAMRAAGGKQLVIREVEQLRPFDLPVLGLIDRDVNASSIPPAIADSIFTWPTADIEGLYLGNEALSVMIDLGLMKSQYRHESDLARLVHNLCMGQRENVIAEIARARAVSMSGYEWPSPRGEGALNRLRSAVSNARSISPNELDAQIAGAEVLWDEAVQHPLQIVRGKYILGAFSAEASEMKSGRALIEAVARAHPPIPAIIDLGKLVDTQLTRAL